MRRLVKMKTSRKIKSIQIKVSENFYRAFEEQKKLEELKIKKKFGLDKSISQAYYSEIISPRLFKLNMEKKRNAIKKINNK